jgi:CheY-like chemotaxis protein
MDYRDVQMLDRLKPGACPARVEHREQHPGLIVMDLHLPGMSGLEAARQTRTNPALATIPIVANTLSSAPITAEHAIFDAVCSTPSSPASLVEAVQRALGIKAEGQRNDVSRR